MNPHGNHHSRRKTKPHTKRRQSLLAKPTLTIKGRFQNCLNRIVHHKIPTLTIRGFIVCCTNEKTKALEQKFDWGNALIDATITSAITFFSALGGGAVAGVNTINMIESAAVAALSQFFIFLALKRGLIQSKEA
jgi:hypothetical protein